MEDVPMEDLTLEQAEYIIAPLADKASLDEIEDYGFAVLKAIAVIRRDLHEREQLLG